MTRKDQIERSSVRTAGVWDLNACSFLIEVSAEHLKRCLDLLRVSILFVEESNRSLLMLRPGDWEWQPDFSIRCRLVVGFFLDASAFFPGCSLWLYGRGEVVLRRNEANGKLMALERWLSGRKHIPAKDAYPYSRYRGFKSHSFRFFAQGLGSPSKHSYYFLGKIFSHWLWVGSGSQVFAPAHAVRVDGVAVPLPFSPFLIFFHLSKTGDYLPITTESSTASGSGKFLFY